MTPLFYVVAGAVALGAGGVAYVRRRARAPKVGIVPAAVAPIRLQGTRVAGIVGADIMPPNEPRPDYTVSRATGWTPVWVKSWKLDTLEWGACVWDLKERQTKAGMRDENKAAQAVVRGIGKAMEWAIAVVKAATLNVSICFRIDVPISRMEIDGYPTMWMPSEPKGGTPIEGFSPGTSRPGFGLVGASIGSEPVEPWPLAGQPKGSPGGAWIRELGDLWDYKRFGRALRVFQIVTLQDGKWRSFVAMSQGDWRFLMIMGGEASAWPDGVVDYLKNNRASGQEYKLHLPTTRTKAMNRFD